MKFCPIYLAFYTFTDFIILKFLTSSSSFWRSWNLFCSFSIINCSLLGWIWVLYEYTWHFWYFSLNIYWIYLILLLVSDLHKLMKYINHTSFFINFVDCFCCIMLSFKSAYDLVYENIILEILRSLVLFKLILSVLFSISLLLNFAIICELVVKYV